jgi:hypothetical protein
MKFYLGDIMKKLQITILVLGFMLLIVYISKTTNIKEFQENNEKLDKEPQKFESLNEGLSKITSDSSQKTVEYLASQELEGRMSGKKGNILAAEFIKNKFESYGYKSKYQKFPIKKLNYGPNKESGDDFTNNILAWSEGKEENLKDEIIVVGAHMDHIGYGPQMSMQSKIKIHPGADDNASGTAALLEIAKGMSKLKNKRTILFIAFSAEEMGLLGSLYYVNNPLFPQDNPNIKNHTFMLNMDMIGYLKKGKQLAGFSDLNSSVDITRYIGELSDKYSFAKSITTRGTSGSDHASFYNKKIPIAFLHTGGHDYYHTPQDTADKLNYNGIENISKYALELIWKISQEENKPVFNHSDFKEMNYDHDHGIKNFNEWSKK